MHIQNHHHVAAQKRLPGVRLPPSQRVFNTRPLVSGGSGKRHERRMKAAADELAKVGITEEGRSSGFLPPGRTLADIINSPAPGDYGDVGAVKVDRAGFRSEAALNRRRAAKGELMGDAAARKRKAASGGEASMHRSSAAPSHVAPHPKQAATYEDLRSAGRTPGPGTYASAYDRDSLAARSMGYAAAMAAEVKRSEQQARWRRRRERTAKRAAGEHASSSEEEEEAGGIDAEAEAMMTTGGAVGYHRGPALSTARRVPVAVIPRAHRAPSMRTHPILADPRMQWIIPPGASGRQVSEAGDLGPGQYSEALNNLDGLQPRRAHVRNSGARFSKATRFETKWQAESKHDAAARSEFYGSLSARAAATDEEQLFQLVKAEHDARATANSRVKARAAAAVAQAEAVQAGTAPVFRYKKPLRKSGGWQRPPPGLASRDATLSWSVTELTPRAPAGAANTNKFNFNNTSQGRRGKGVVVSGAHAPSPLLLGNATAPPKFGGGGAAKRWGESSVESLPSVSGGTGPMKLPGPPGNRAAVRLSGGGKNANVPPLALGEISPDSSSPSAQGISKADVERFLRYNLVPGHRTSARASLHPPAAHPDSARLLAAADALRTGNGFNLEHEAEQAVLDKYEAEEDVRAVLQRTTRPRSPGSPSDAVGLADTGLSLASDVRRAASRNGADGAPRPAQSARSRATARTAASVLQSSVSARADSAAATVRRLDVNAEAASLRRAAAQLELQAHQAAHMQRLQHHAVFKRKRMWALVLGHAVAAQRMLEVVRRRRGARLAENMQRALLYQQRKTFQAWKAWLRRKHLLQTAVNFRMQLMMAMRNYRQRRLHRGATVVTQFLHDVTNTFEATRSIRRYQHKVSRAKGWLRRVAACRQAQSWLVSKQFDRAVTYVRLQAFKTKLIDARSSMGSSIAPEAPSARSGGGSFSPRATRSSAERSALLPSVVIPAIYLARGCRNQADMDAWDADEAGRAAVLQAQAKTRIARAKARSRARAARKRGVKLSISAAVSTALSGDGSAVGGIVPELSMDPEAGGGEANVEGGQHAPTHSLRMSASSHSSAHMSPSLRAAKGGSASMNPGLRAIMGEGGEGGASAAVTVGDLFDDDDEDELRQGGALSAEGGRQSQASFAGEGGAASAARLSACASAALLSQQDWEHVLEGIFQVQPGTNSSQRSLHGGGFNRNSALTASRISLVTGVQYIPAAVAGTGSLDEEMWAQAGASASTPLILSPVRMAAIQRGSRMRTHLPTSNEMTAGIDVGPLKVGAPPPRAGRRLSVELAAIQLRILTEFPSVERDAKHAIVSALLLSQRQAFARQLQAWREETAAFHRGLEEELQRAETKLYLIKSMQDPAGALLPAGQDSTGGLQANTVDPAHLAQLRAFLELRAPPRPQFSPLLSYKLLLPIVKQALSEQRTRDIERSSDDADALATARSSSRAQSKAAAKDAPPTTQPAAMPGDEVGGSTVRFEAPMAAVPGGSPAWGGALVIETGVVKGPKGGSSPSSGGLTELQRSKNAARSRMLRARKRKAAANGDSSRRGGLSGQMGGAHAATLLTLMERASSMHQTASTAVRRSQAAALEHTAREAAAASTTPQ